MIKKYFEIQFVFAVLMIFAFPVFAANIVIDPGHNGFEQNRGGGAFTVDFVGDQLRVGADTGSFVLKVQDASHFSDTTGYRTIKVDNETLTLTDVDYENDELLLTSGTNEQHDQFASVKTVDFLVQAMGRKFDGTEPDSWAGSDTDFDELSYTHLVSADEWDSWARKIKTDGTRLGLLEVLNTWEIATRLRDELDTGLGHTVTMTKTQPL